MKRSLVLVLALCATALTACTTAPAPTHLALSSPAVSQQSPVTPTRLALSSPAGNRQFPGCRYQCSDLDW